MARFGMGTVLGAGAAGAYGMQQVNQTGFSGFVHKFFPNMELPNMSPAIQSASNSAELTALQKEMQKLAGVVSDIARNSNKPTVVHLGGSRGWSVVILPAVGTGVVLYLYCRLTGQSILDFFYVSRSSLANFRNTVQEGMNKMWDEMRKTKEQFVTMVGTLGRKQDEMKDSQEQLMVKQDQMDERLRRVDDTVFSLDTKANHTINRVERLDNRLQDVHAGVQAANHGIFMLVSAVSEVTHKIGLHNSRTAQALKNYAQNGPAWQSGSPPAVAAGAAPPALPGIESKSAASTSASSSKADTPQVGGLRGLGGLMDGGEPDSSHMSLGGSMSMDHAAFVVPAAGAAADAPVVGSCVIQEVTSLDSAASAPVALIGDNKGSFGRMFGFSRA